MSMNNISNTRRNFIKKMLTATILTVTCPHVVLGKIEPKLKSKGDKLLGLYEISLKDYPQLKEMWASIKMKVNYDKGYIEGFFANIIVTHVPKEIYDVDYTCMYDMCPHEGFPIETLNPISHDFECTGHGTLFEADGTYKEGPAAQDLEVFEVFYDDEDTLSIEIPRYIVGVEDDATNLFYLEQNMPNPVSTTTSISYGVEKSAFVSIVLYSLSGKETMKIVNKYHLPGHYDININLQGLSPGVYIYKLTVDSDTPIVRKLIKR
jgi:nitrite reductase/ring-hydroxylating ferredoxin subunit